MAKKSKDITKKDKKKNKFLYVLYYGVVTGLVAGLFHWAVGLMLEIFHVAILLICFRGECTTFESAPYSKDLSLENCERMLSYTFQTQVGPYYDNIIDFDKDKPEDIEIVDGGCDVTDRKDNLWKITPNVNPDLNEE